MESEPSITMTMSRDSPPKSQELFWKRLSAAAAAIAMSVVNIAVARSPFLVFLDFQRAAATPAEMAATARSGIVIGQVNAGWLKRNGRAIAVTIAAIARHRRTSSMISSISRRRRCVSRDAERKRIAPQAIGFAFLRFKMCISTGMETSVIPSII